MKINLSLLKVIGLCAVFSILFSGAVFAVDTYLSQNMPQNPAELKDFYENLQNQQNKIQQQINEQSSKISVAKAVWPGVFPVYPGASSYRGGSSDFLNPAMAYFKEENRYVVSYLLDVKDAPEAVIEWYKNNAEKYGFSASEDASSDALKKVLIVDPSMRTVYLWRSMDSGLCEYFFVGSSRSSKPGMIMGTESNADGSPKEVVCPSLSQEWNPQEPSLETQGGSSEECYSTKEEQQEIDSLLQAVKSKFKVSIDTKNVLCEEENCPNQKPLDAKDLTEILNTLTKLPGCFTDKLRGALIRGPSNKPVVGQVEKEYCCKTGGYGAWMFYDDAVLVCGKNAEKSNISIGQLLSHELTHYWQNEFVTTIPMGTPQRSYFNPYVIYWIQQTGWIPEGGSKLIPYCYPVIGCKGLITPPDAPEGYNAAKIDPLEDMAHSVQIYVYDPEYLKRVSLRRYNFIRDKIMCQTEFVP